MGGGSGGCLESFIELAVVLAALVEWRGGAVALVEDGLEMRGECVGQWDAKAFAWVGVVALGIHESDHLFLKIHGIAAKLRLGESAAEMRAYLEGGEHPRGTTALGECGARGNEILGSELLFYLRRFAGNLRQGEGIFLSQLPAHGLLHDAGEKLDLESCGIL